MKPTIVAVIEKPGSINRTARLARKHGAGMLEVRLDLMGTESRQSIRIIKDARKASRLPLIATIRLKSEGGKFKGGEKERLALYQDILPFADMVDIELSAVILKQVLKACKKARKKAIVSYHNFQQTPGTGALNKLVKRASGLKPDVIKIATLIKGPDDFLRLSGVLFSRPKNALAIVPMSRQKHFSILRLISHNIGSKLTYFSTGSTVAPGQLRLADFSRFSSQHTV